MNTKIIHNHLIPSINLNYYIPSNNKKTLEIMHFQIIIQRKDPLTHINPIESIGKRMMYQLIKMIPRSSGFWFRYLQQLYTIQSNEQFVRQSINSSEKSESKQKGKENKIYYDNLKNVPIKSKHQKTKFLSPPT